MDTLHGMALREPVASFDLFDTLMTRRCIHPPEVFQLVAGRIGMPGFVALRHHAQDLAIRRCAPADYTLADIYDDLAMLAGLPSDEAAAIMALEVEIEIDQVVPVRQTLARVRPQDIIVSDMYLGHAVLERIVRQKLELAHNRLFVSCDGKTTGRIWHEMQRRYDIALHLGDNPVSDVARPAAAGIATELTTLTAPSVLEQYLLALGLGVLARSVREARLSSWHEDPQLRDLQLGQIQANFPFLLMVAQDLVHVVRESGTRRLLLCGRDFHRLSFIMPIMLRRAGLDCTATYFHSSRLARLHASDAYRAYFDRLRGDERTIVADLCGSGRSLQVLLDAAGPARTSLYLAHEYDQETPALGHYRRPQASAHPITAMLRGPAHPWLAFELLNRAGHPYVTDMARWEDEFVPVFAGRPLDETVSRAIVVQDEAFALAARLYLASSSSDPVPNRDQLREIAGTLGGHAGTFLTGSMAMLMQHQSLEEVDVSARIDSQCRAMASSGMTKQVLEGAGT